jgi:putative ABC transport system permease protein
VGIRALLTVLWRNKTGPLLVCAQVAITLAVLVNVAYIVRLRVEEASKPTGLDLHNMFWIATQPSSANYNYAAASKADQMYLNSLPGVVAASVAYILPQTDDSVGLFFASNSELLQRQNGGVWGRVYYGTDKYIDALGLKLIAGRNFDPNAIVPPAKDWSTSISGWAPEIIVTQAMAKQLFPDGNAVGQTVYASNVSRPATIVGIVDSMQGQPAPAVFEPYVTQIVIAPIIPPGPDGLYIVRAKPGQRAALMAQLEKNFADLQPGRFVSRIESYDVTAAAIRQGTRASAIILAVVAALVLAVTVVGISGLAAFHVATRTKQLGIRRAIGARRFHILRYFLIENWIITTCGTLLGCALAIATGIVLSNLYYLPRLPLYYLVAGVLVLWIIGLLAVLVPALRAASTSPAVATRTV